jgi:hypothetical protein
MQNYVPNQKREYFASKIQLYFAEGKGGNFHLTEGLSPERKTTNTQPMKCSTVQPQWSGQF